MNWNEYLINAEKTMSKEFFSTPEISYLLHAGLGVITEVEEIIQNNKSARPDDVNLFEEIGDVTWYLSILARETGAVWKNYIPSTETLEERLFNMLCDFFTNLGYERVNTDNLVLFYSPDGIYETRFRFPQKFDLDEFKSVISSYKYNLEFESRSWQNVTGERKLIDDYYTIIYKVIKTHHKRLTITDLEHFQYNYLGYVMNRTAHDVLLDIVEYNCSLLDILKKKLFYNKPINPEVFKEKTQRLFDVVAEYLYINNLDAEKVFQVNIDKLKARYGEKFSSEKAINRDLESERKILESGNN